jgi:hypothetical protein
MTIDISRVSSKTMHFFLITIIPYYFTLLLQARGLRVVCDSSRFFSFRLFVDVNYPHRHTVGDSLSVMEFISFKSTKHSSRKMTTFHG